MLRIISCICLIFFISIPLVDASKKQIIEDVVDLTKQHLLKKHIQTIKENTHCLQKRLQIIKNAKNYKQSPKHFFQQIMGISNKLRLSESSRPETLHGHDDLMTLQFLPLKAYKVNLNNKMLVSSRNNSSFAELFFQANNTVLPLGYTDKNESEIFKDCTVHLGLYVSKTPLSEMINACTQPQTRQYSVRIIKVDELYESLLTGKRMIPNWYTYIFSRTKVDLSELNAYLEVWYDFKSIKRQVTYLETLQKNDENLSDYEDLKNRIQDMGKIQDDILNQKTVSRLRTGLLYTAATLGGACITTGAVTVLKIILYFMHY